MSRSVLLVEDYADLRSVVSAALVRGDYSCDCARSSDDALLMIRQKQYDAVLISPRVAIKDDPVVRYLAERDPAQTSPRLIVMTEPEAASPNNAEYRTLLKPFNNEQLLAELPA